MSITHLFFGVVVLLCLVWTIILLYKYFSKNYIGKKPTTKDLIFATVICGLMVGIFTINMIRRELPMPRRSTNPSTQQGSHTQQSRDAILREISREITNIITSGADYEDVRIYINNKTYSLRQQFDDFASIHTVVGRDGIFNAERTYMRGDEFVQRDDFEPELEAWYKDATKEGIGKINITELHTDVATGKTITTYSLSIHENKNPSTIGYCIGIVAMDWFADTQSQQGSGSSPQHGSQDPQQPGVTSPEQGSSASSGSKVIDVSILHHFAVGLRADGTVAYAGSNERVREELGSWRNIIQVEAGSSDIIGLKSDGTVVTVNTDGKKYDVENWTNIIAVAAGAESIFALRSDGTYNCVVFGTVFENEGSNIKAISAGPNGNALLSADGTVNIDTWNMDRVEQWSDIIAISGGGGRVMGLKSDGTVVASDYYTDEEKAEIAGWRNITALSVGLVDIALKSDGTVVTLNNPRSDRSGKIEFNNAFRATNWTDIVAIASGDTHIIGIKSDGSVVVVNNENYSSRATVILDFSSW